MDMLWFKNIPIIWISAGIPLTIVGVYFLVKFFDRTNRIDEKQRQQIALNEAKIERIKNENYENIQRNSNSSGWLSSIYFLIFFGLIIGAFQDRNNSKDNGVENNLSNSPARKVLSDNELKQYCTLEKICKEYQTERMNCSTAGNFSTCMTIRMRKYDFNYAQYHCNGEKILGYDGYEAPGILQCLLETD
jgi:hypothetical protein